MHAITIGLYIAKSVFQVHGKDLAGKVVLQKGLRRGQVAAFFAELAPARVRDRGVRQRASTARRNAWRPDPRNPSGPAVSRPPTTGRIHDRSRPNATAARNSLPNGGRPYMTGGMSLRAQRGNLAEHKPAGGRKRCADTAGAPHKTQKIFPGQPYAKAGNPSSRSERLPWTPAFARVTSPRRTYSEFEQVHERFEPV